MKAFGGNKVLGEDENKGVSGFMRHEDQVSR